MQTCKWYRTPQYLIYCVFPATLSRMKRAARGKTKYGVLSSPNIVPLPQGCKWNRSSEMEQSAESSPKCYFTGTTGCPLLSTKATSITSCHGGAMKMEAETKREREKRFVSWCLSRSHVLQREMHFHEGSHVEVNLHTGQQWHYAHSYPEIPAKTFTKVQL